jgi:hypothetical protein
MKRERAENIPLIPFEDFQQNARKILSNTKAESDRQLAKFQASNVRKRAAKKKKR